MKILLHICCAPCAIYPIKVIQKEKHTLEGYFYNPNIHPFKEFCRRLDTVTAFEEQAGFKIFCNKEYGLKEYLRNIVFHEEKRCSICYHMRLTATVMQAKKINADAFSTTLLYSRYQNHALIKEQAENLSKEHGIDFFYSDFREGWQEGIELSRQAKMYRQPYCGCVYSEQERYDKVYKRGK
jgi:epoxyqueuosine reductase